MLNVSMAKSILNAAERMLGAEAKAVTCLKPARGWVF